MALTGGIVDVYIISTAIGSIYLAFSAALGHLGGSDGGHGGEGVGHGHSALDSQSTTGGHGPHSAADSSHGNLPAHGHNHSLSSGNHPTGITHAQPRLAGIGSTLLTLLSPMTISVFLAFFGLSGLLTIKIIPWLGLLTIIPALIVGFLITKVVLRMFSWLLKSTDVSSVARINEVIGQMAQVSVPIKEGRTGEIICEMGSKRYNYPARAVQAEHTFVNGSRVIIADMRDGIAFVEPWNDVLLD